MNTNDKKNQNKKDEVNKNTLTKGRKREIFMNSALDNMKKTQEKMIKEYGLGKENNRFIMFPERNDFICIMKKLKKFSWRQDSK